MRSALAVASFALALTWSGPASADNDLRWVEVEVHVAADGGAQVRYQTRWSSTGGMHGFYFQGSAGQPRWRMAESVAELPDRSNVPLEIVDLGGRWDIILAGGRDWGPGEATYFFSYDVDLVDAGVFGTTAADDGARVFFNWSPVEWDEALDHETVKVVFDSVAAPAGDLGLDGASALGLRTEPFVNERYRIMYEGIPQGDKHVLGVTFHREPIAPRDDHRVQLYLWAADFPALGAKVEARREREAEAQRLYEERAAQEAIEREAATIRDRAYGAQEMLYRAYFERERGWRGWTGISALLVLFAGVMLRKHKGLAQASATAPDLLWERDDWEPPRIRVSSFRVPGKIAELG
ncbi:MAG: hypothetical protein KC420_05270, partial [Myxococcales bacterium]|nr:hypothetical protein [Myxococcales bacterium]